MTPGPTSEAALQQASDLLQQNRPPQEAAAVLRDISRGDAHFPRAQFLRAICAFRGGDFGAAKDLLVDAARGGEREDVVWLALARTAAATGMPDDALATLLEGLKAVPAPALVPFLLRVLQALGFVGKGTNPGKDKVFTDILLPLLSALLERRDMDGAMTLETVLYEYYVKAIETEAHFAACMARIAPPFTAAGLAWREALPPLPQPSLVPPYRIGFFLHSASTLAHVEVLLNTLKGYRMLDEQPFEPTVYCFSGKSAPMEEALARLGVRLVMLNERFPETGGSGWARLLRFRELLSEEGVQELVWVSVVTMMSLAFAMRIAPVQTWLAMKYRNFSHPDIDGYVTGSALTRFASLFGRRWRMARLGVDDWYDPTLEEAARAIRTSLGDQTVLMTLGRTEKMRDPAYLGAMVQILQDRPETCFLWAGREEDAQVVAAFRAGGVLDRTHFIGWVNTRLYAQVADVFLDTFPPPCGFTLFQAMAAAKPVVIYDSPEAAQTGLWNFLRPLIDGDEGEPDERAEVRSIVGDPDNPLISVSRSPEDYVALAKRLIDDPAARAAGGEASRRFIQRYLSDPRVLGSMTAEHLVELIDQRRASA